MIARRFNDDKTLQQTGCGKNLAKVIDPSGFTLLLETQITGYIEPTRLFRVIIDRSSLDLLTFLFPRLSGNGRVW